MTDARIPPHVSSLSRPFWDAAARRELMRPVCDDCGRSFFVPRPACPHCLSEAWSWVPSAGRGRVHSHTTVHRAPRAGFEVPYVVADVDLDEGWNMMSNVVDVAPETVTIGQRVAVTFLDVADGVALPVFRPDPEASA